MKLKLLTACLLSITVWSGCRKTEQDEPDKTWDRHYELPVIFHVLYQNPADKYQYVSPDRLKELISIVNSRYRGSVSSPDMNLTFVLAETDESGNRLSVPGVEYIRWDGEYPIDCDQFMSGNIPDTKELMWDPNGYINIMVYNFTNTDSNATTLGISHLPYSTKGETFLDGLTEVAYSYINKDELGYARCVSINSLYIYYQSTAQVYTGADASVTLAHELGHYLGLLHVFCRRTGECGPDCPDTDYCDDTKCYNYTEYTDFLNGLNSPGQTFENLAKRTSCQDGSQFFSRNIMDYAYSYSDQFTEDQKERIRHVLMFSPLIPGPKASVAKTRASSGETLDLPVRFIE